MFACIALLVATLSLSTGQKAEEHAAKNSTRNIFTSALGIRIIPADVLRDYPDQCFASTQYRLYSPNQSWDLTPYCGIATCLPNVEGDSPRFIEQVSDCGPEPIQVPKLQDGETPKCNLSVELTNTSARYPDCCPIYECEEGFKLEFPIFAQVEDAEEGDDEKKKGSDGDPKKE